MKSQSILIAFLALLRVGLAALNANDGLGISLSSGYVTLSVHLENGSYVDLAKIEGGERYKAYMSGSQEEPSAVHVLAKYCPFSRDVCQRYWPITAVVQPPNLLAPILQALVAVGEATLERSIDSVTVSVFAFSTINDTLAQRDVESALDGFGVSSWHRLHHVVRQLVHALGIRGRCSGPYTLPEDPGYYAEPEKLILTVEYTRQSLTAGLWEEDCGVVSMLGGFHTTKLGHYAQDTCRRTESSTSCDETFKSAFRDVFRDVFRRRESRSSTDYQLIDAVLVFDEQADDLGMRNLLRQVLKERFPDGESADLSLVQRIADDPAFVGSRAMALAESGAREIAREEAQYLAKDL